MKQQNTCIMYTIIIGMYEKASTEKPHFFFFLNKGPVEKRYYSGWQPIPTQWWWLERCLVVLTGSIAINWLIWSAGFSPATLSHWTVNFLKNMYLHLGDSHHIFGQFNKDQEPVLIPTHHIWVCFPFPRGGCEEEEGPPAAHVVPCRHRCAGCGSEGEEKG